MKAGGKTRTMTTRGYGSRLSRLDKSALSYYVPSLTDCGHRQNVGVRHKQQHLDSSRDILMRLAWAVGTCTTSSRD